MLFRSEFRERIGVKPETLPTVEEAKARQKTDREKMEARHLREADYWLDQQEGYYRNKIKDLKERHKEERLEKAGEIKAYYERNRPEAVRKAFQNLHEYDSNREGYQEARIAADKKGELEKRVKGFRGGARKITANFEEIYRDPPKAREKFKSFFEEHGANKAARELDARPETFGKLRGNQFTETKAGQFLRKKLSITGETERNQAIEQARKASRNLDRMIKSIGRAKWEAERLGGEVDRFMKTERIERAALLVDLAISAKGLTRDEWKTLDDWQKQQVKAAREKMKSLEPEDWRAISKRRKYPKGLSPVERRQKEELQEIKARRDEERRQIREREEKDAKRQAQKERAEARKKLTRTLAKEQEQSKGRGRSRERSRGEG